MIDEDELVICHECVGDEFLKKEIQAEGKIDNCSYCKKKRKIMVLTWLAERVNSAILEHYFLTPEEPTDYEQMMLSDKGSHYNWLRLGVPIGIIIEDITRVNVKIASDIQEYLSLCYGGDPSEPVDDPYGATECYEEKPPDKYPFLESWKLFCQEIRYKARFFSQLSEDVLGELFNNLDSLKTFIGKSVVCCAGPGTEIPNIFRARVAQLQPTLDIILKNPVQELAAPPPRSSKHGRMNAAGISVFYGATDADTCVEEVRPPVGSNVVIGRFQIIRNIRLLDLNILSQIYVKGSCFDPEFEGRLGHAAFLQHLVGELTKPIMPDEETFEYLPTQFVAEYLAKKVKPRLDGIIFNSSQSQEKGQNIILFHDSCRVEPYKLPEGTKVSIQPMWSTAEEDEDGITVYEELPSKSQMKKLKHTDKAEFQDDLVTNRKITLRLDVNKNINVKIITGAKYQSRERSTSRRRHNKGEEGDVD